MEEVVKKIEVRKCRGIVLECHGEEVYAGVVAVVFDVLLIDHKSGERIHIVDRMLNLRDDVRMNELSHFIEEHALKFDDYEDLTGMVFDVDLAYDTLRGEIVSNIENRILVAPPFAM